MKTWLQKFIGRIVLGLFTLIVLPVLPAIVDGANKLFSLGLTVAQVQEYATNAAYGVAGLAAVWLLNSGKFERLAHTAQDLIGEGKEFADAEEAADLGEQPAADKPPLPRKSA